MLDKDEEQNVPEKSPQHKVDKEETFASSPLHEACRKGNLTRVRRILSQGLVDINSRDGNHGKTPLMVAAQEGHCRIVYCLKGVSMTQVDNNGKNFLHWACKGGHVGMVECVLPQYDIDINNKNVSPLLQAAWLGQRDVCEFLVCMGANVSQVDDDGDNALHWGCRGGHLGIVKYLLSLCSLDINSKGKGGKTPVMHAASWKHTRVCELLVSRGANLSEVDDNSNNVLHIASKFGQLDVMKSLLSQGNVNITSRGPHGRTPLMNAAYYGRTKVFDLLANKGGITHLVDDQGHNILHLASMHGCLQMVKHIISQNMADINARDKNGKTAAMIAKHERRVYNFLVSRGCLVK
ncbi:26S proteasome non-ATPase regulatory subunit 10-like [Haliotis rubra]|uniref:26S proteasome non-ATPase regulatory subunit 10-like n=1 Tax=Haliotis rubra TaxID=36100 RepID=UPI001EE5C4EC|nr:26S proteasome non-ATPase regulatory subunit 10-like [Haliotis rubra]